MENLLYLDHGAQVGVAEGGVTSSGGGRGGRPAHHAGEGLHLPGREEQGAGHQVAKSSMNADLAFSYLYFSVKGDS